MRASFEDVGVRRTFCAVNRTDSFEQLALMAHRRQRERAESDKTLPDFFACLPLKARDLWTERKPAKVA